MGYVLSAFIGAEPTVETAAALTGQRHVSRLDRSLHIIELNHHLLGRQQRYSDRFNSLTPQLAHAASVASAVGDIGYIEAEFFGGDGSQACMVWRNGEVVFGPLRADDEEPPVPPMRDRPINQALRFLGVEASPGSDEFDKVGLWRFG